MLGTDYFTYLLICRLAFFSSAVWENEMKEKEDSNVFLK